MLEISGIFELKRLMIRKIPQLLVSFITFNTYISIGVVFTLLKIIFKSHSKLFLVFIYKNERNSAFKHNKIGYFFFLGQFHFVLRQCLFIYGNISGCN